MAKAVIQVFIPQVGTSQFIGTDKRSIRLGRGLDNDIIVSDPYISACHLEITETEEGHWQIRDLNSDNGTYLKSGKRIKEARIASGDELIIGRVRLRIFSPQHQVEPTRQLRSKNHLLIHLNTLPIRLLSIILLIVFAMLTTYFDITSTDTHDEFWVEGLSVSIAWMATIMLISGFLALIGRLAHHQPQFRLQVVILTLSCVVIGLAWLVLDYLSYVLDNEAALIMIGLLKVLPVLFVLDYSLSLATSMTRSARIKFLSISGVFIIAISALFYFHSREEFHNEPKYVIRVYPPLLGIKLGKPIDTFLERAQNVFEIELEEESTL